MNDTQEILIGVTPRSGYKLAKHQEIRAVNSEGWGHICKWRIIEQGEPIGVWEHFVNDDGYNDEELNTEGKSIPHGTKLYTHAAPAHPEPAMCKTVAPNVEAITGNTYKYPSDVPFTQTSSTEPARAVPDVSTMVDRFLGWKLPEDFAPDCGIGFDPGYGGLDSEGKFVIKERQPDTHWWPTGTNLFHAGQARAMIEYLLATPPSAGEKS